MAVGKGPVGFLNPALYANPSVMNDIVNGSNVGCESTSSPGLRPRWQLQVAVNRKTDRCGITGYTEGFQAAPGWDPASGLGTPNYPKVLDLFMSLP